ncbi:MAG: type II toxin-antitoxin system PemK/MazF family toxin [Micrococcales bacterium]|nr:type II toxin-antitoxin system PemK/MazF family toxin [Micrococcales bacterium]
MRRGEVWTLRGLRFADKPRPGVIVQSDLLDGFDSIVVALFTTVERHEARTRVAVEPNRGNGLKARSLVMTEKLVTARRSDLGVRVGALTAEQMRAISRSLAEVLEITEADVA